MYTECRNSKECAPAKHHFDECVERVTAAQSEEGGAKEDCVEECKLYVLIVHEFYMSTALTWLVTQNSLPPCPLRYRLRRAQALVRPQINSHKFINPSRWSPSLFTNHQSRTRLSSSRLLGYGWGALFFSAHCMHGFDRMGYGVPIDKCEREEGRRGGKGGGTRRGEIWAWKKWLGGGEGILSLSLSLHCIIE